MRALAKVHKTACCVGVHNVGARGVGTHYVGADGVSAHNVGARGVGAYYVGADGVSARGVGTRTETRGAGTGRIRCTRIAGKEGSYAQRREEEHDRGADTGQPHV